jgi:protein-tyrosine phosphatase
MGNNLNVDLKISQIDEIINFPSEDMDSLIKEKEDSAGFQNLKVWKFYENENEQIQSEAILLPVIWENKFLLNSTQAYIILLIDKGNSDSTEVTGFPTSFWGLVESSSNMTPRGLKYAFSTSNDKSETLESFMLSKRDFKNSDFKFVLFIWNGKNCGSLIKSTVLMKAFDLDKKLSNPTILPYLYYGYYIEKNIFNKGGVVKLNEVISNTIEHMADDIIQTPNSESLFNYQETVYLLQWLYPIDEKKSSKRISNKEHKRVLFNKFNNNFLSGPNKKKYLDCFTYIGQKQKKSIYEKEEISSRNLDKTDHANNHEEINSGNEECEELEESNEEYVEDDESLDDINLNEVEKLNETKFTLKKINIEGIKTNNQTNNSNIKTINDEIKVPKINLKFQHKILNPTERSKQLSEEEERLDSLGSNTIRKASDMILKNDIKGFTLDLNKKNRIAAKSDIDEKNGEEEEGIYDKHTETHRKDLINDFFSKNMTVIIDDFLYLSSYKVAKNKEVVYENKITHIINAAADICQNHFESDIEYLSFNLKDHSIENIECLFYECINYIESVRSNGGRILVHCIQGISRSVSIVVAYLIYKNKMNYDQAFKFVESKRSIASPNLGFGIQLQLFYQRLYEPIEGFRYYPKIFSIGSFQVEQPEKIVCRMVNLT